MYPSSPKESHICADSGWAGRSQLLEEHYLARDADEMLAAAEADDDDESGDDDESDGGESDASDGGGDDASSGSDAAPMQRAATHRAAVPRSAPAPRSASRALTDAAKARIKAIPTVCGPSLNQLSLLPCTGSIRQSRIVRD
jgi:hypothetical protein